LFNHIPGGSNVLYMDGHVGFVRYQGGMPIESGTGPQMILMRSSEISTTA
jgi:prepilin-type processing-associated H-X9-DG protein